jgi:type I restriction enzyme R subunit
MDGNEEIFDRIMNDPAFRNLASEQLMREVYKRLRNREPRPRGPEGGRLN